MKTGAHLGGHAGITHIDEAALRWAIARWKAQSFLDIGCGPGGMVRLASKLLRLADGIDGDPSIDGFPGLIRHDFTKGICVGLKKYDLGWSVEFLEHIEERFLPNAMHAFQRCRFVIMTAAPPGAGGHHHVNCQPSDYWIKVFRQYGFRFLERHTAQAKERSTMARDFLRSTGLVFRQRNAHF